MSVAPDVPNNPIADLRQALNDLRLFVDKNDSEIREGLGKVDLTVTDLDRVVYGNSRQDTPGIIKRVQTLEAIVESLETTRIEQMATMKGIKIGLAVTGLTGAGTLLSVLSQLFQ